MQRLVAQASFSATFSHTPPPLPKRSLAFQGLLDAKFNYQTGPQLRWDAAIQKLSPASSRLSIGREEGQDICLPVSSMSRKHALVTLVSGQVRLTDLGSSNGTWHSRPLKHNQPVPWDFAADLREIPDGAHLPGMFSNYPELLSNAGKLKIIGLSQQKDGEQMEISSSKNRDLFNGMGMVGSSPIQLRFEKKQGQTWVTFLKGPKPLYLIQKLTPSTSVLLHEGDRIEFPEQLVIQVTGLSQVNQNGKSPLPIQANPITPPASSNASGAELTQETPSLQALLAQLKKQVQWRYLVRDLSQNPDLSDLAIYTYWQNNAKAYKRIKEGLKPSSPDWKTAEAFEAFLKEVHCLAALGHRDPKNQTPELYYQKHGQLMPLKELKPGQFRTECMQNKYQKEAEEVAELAKHYGDPYTLDGEQTVNLPGLNPKQCPTNVGAYHFYPAPMHIKVYLKQMHLLLSELLQVASQELRPKTETMNKIALFYQYAANIRPFEQINNSVFMLMTNHLLTLYGLPGVPHGKLDHAAQRLQPAAFARLFRDWVDKHDSDILVFRTGSSSSSGLKPFASGLLRESVSVKAAQIDVELTEDKAIDAKTQMQFKERLTRIARASSQLASQVESTGGTGFLFEAGSAARVLEERQVLMQQYLQALHNKEPAAIQLAQFSLAAHILEQGTDMALLSEIQKAMKPLVKNK